MNTNPYESPKSQVTLLPPHSEERTAALRSVHIALLVMLAPAIYNLICSSFFVDMNRTGLPIHSIYRTLNTIGLVAITTAIWFFGLAALDFVTGGLYSVFSRRATLDNWKTTLYITLRRAPVFAFFGAVLWAIWVAAFYQFGFGFYTVSVPIGVAAHLLAAGLYLPLIYQWYKIECSSAS